jgi:hypothetical protein
MSTNYRKILETEGMPAVIPEGCAYAVDTTQEPPVFYYWRKSTAKVEVFNTSGINVLDEDDMSSDSTTNPPSQQSVKTYVDSRVLDEDDMSSNSATRPPSQQSVKAYVDDAVQDPDIQFFAGYIDADTAFGPRRITYTRWGNMVMLSSVLTAGSSIQTDIATNDPLPDGPPGGVRPVGVIYKAVPYYDDSTGEMLTCMVTVNQDGTITFTPPNGITPAISDVIYLNIVYITN